MRRWLSVAVAVVLLVLGSACSDGDGDDPAEGSVDERSDVEVEASDVSLEDVSACALLTNDQVTEAVDSEVVGSSPVPGGDDACAFAYGDSITVAPPDGPHVLVVIDRKAEVESDADAIEGVDLPVRWDADDETLALQVGEGTVTLSVEDDGDADAHVVTAVLAPAVERALDAAANPTTSSSAPTPPTSPTTVADGPPTS